jgi:hypothetical protein
MVRSPCLLKPEDRLQSPFSGGCALFEREPKPVVEDICCGRALQDEGVVRLKDKPTKLMLFRNSMPAPLLKGAILIPNFPMVS